MRDDDLPPRPPTILMPARIPTSEQPRIILDGRDSSSLLASIADMAKAHNAMVKIYGDAVAPMLQRILEEQSNARRERAEDRAAQVADHGDLVSLALRVTRLETRISNRPSYLVTLSVIIAITAGASASGLTWLLTS